MSMEEDFLRAQIFCSGSVKILWMT